MTIVQGDISICSLIRQFKHGIATLSNHQFASVSGFHLSVASLLSVAGLIFAVREVGNIANIGSLTRSSDENTPSVENLLVPGLQNLGNNCFLNVVLQALASCSYFQSFLDKAAEEFEYLLAEERVESLPLVVALETLLQDLSTLCHGREVLSPRRVMHAIDHHIHNFNLTCQQDAEEALFHILSSVREELSECYVPNRSSLADATALDTLRIINTLETKSVKSEHARWQRSFVGPFNGILGSYLTCQSCSFQISLDFQFFHSLHLSPVIAGCSVEDCLRQFCSAELLENYHCTNCWHIAAIKYLSLMEENGTDIKKLRDCSKQDSCECKNLPRLLALPWSNGFSRTFKQLNIARSPKILCLHIQRASVNVFGELVKLEGHIFFPLTLNISQFINTEIGMKKYGENFEHGILHQRYPPQFTTRMLTGIREQTRNKCSPRKVDDVDVFSANMDKILDTRNTKSFQDESSTNDKVNGTLTKYSEGDNRYSLVSVVQHFGRGGMGHYTVYRRVRVKLQEPNRYGSLYSSQWFSVSDSSVHKVSEKDVLSAEASLLFYEKLSEKESENYSS